MLKSIKNSIKRRLGFSKLSAVELRREEISNRVHDLLKGTVAYGPFRGLRLEPPTYWGIGDRASMLLGLYEREVLESLVSISRGKRVFVDVGAAEGYYAVGALAANLFEKAYCFEMTAEGRAAILRHAALNNVSDRLVIKGRADLDFYKEIPDADLNDAAFLVDIEGAEFALLNAKTFDRLALSPVLIELHDWTIPNGSELLLRLKNDASQTHDLCEIAARSRDLSQFPELDSFHDTDRWLICSEGRPRAMKWLLLNPRRSC